jgi:SAM-dependent methyltransferase
LNILDYVNGICSLTGARVLDFGCGVKLAQALLQEEYGLTKYVGLDVYREMIAYLQTHVSDPRFSFSPLNFQNDMYNKSGDPMTGSSRLPIEDDQFELVAMFSVITHMNPRDAEATLRILRGYVAPDGYLIFSAFVDPSQVESFVDLVPSRPLLRASYQRDFLERIIQQAGWHIQEYRRPIPQVLQHHYICRPA